AFRINAVFVVANVTLNITLIFLYGWLGAAVATATSIAISLVLAYRHVAAIIDFSLPIAEIAKQWLAAIVMAGVVYGGLTIENTYRLLRHNVATVLLFAGVGAAVYFLTLFGISEQFRRTVNRNLPFELPLS
ncbi:MAG TPA: polysaccharide biosynthesis C-terminal domain-containing protein, partial [Natrialbaceae archaeon]|nr:polysaccharide biosynthesis C-terminal domain-containing protein [Natrialbaceae archaeon]